MAGYYQRSTSRSTRPAAQNSRERNILASTVQLQNRKRDPPRSLFAWFRALCMACLMILRVSERRLLIGDTQNSQGSLNNNKK